MQTILSALEPLDEETRRRLLLSAATLVGVDLRGAMAAAAHLTPQSPLQPILSQQHARPIAPPTARTSPVELLQQKQPVTNAQRLALFAYYREHVEGYARFSRDDLKSYFAKAKIPPPENYARDFTTAAKFGWIYEDGDESYLTTKGQEVVTAGFGGKQQPRGLLTKGKRKSVSKRPAKKKARSHK
jgi:hypothetical protein